MPKQWLEIYQKLDKLGLATGEPEIYQKPNRFTPDPTKELILRSLSENQVYELFNFLQSEEIGFFQIWCFNANLPLRNINSGSVIYAASASGKDSSDLAPLVYDVTRDPSQAEFVADISLFNVKREPLETWILRDFFISCQKSDILTQYEPEYITGQPFQALRIRRVQENEMRKMLEIIFKNSEIGGFRLQLTSNRLSRPKHDGVLKQKDQQIILHEFNASRLRDALYEQNKSLYEEPVRLPFSENLETTDKND